MPQQCDFPYCKSMSVNGLHCIGHAKLSGYEKPVKAKVKIANKAKKEVINHRKYIKIVKEQAATDDRCKVGAPGCTRIMQGFNHPQKRSPKNKMDKNNLVPCCNSCNQFIENNTEWSKANGHLISRFKK